MFDFLVCVDERLTTQCEWGQAWAVSWQSQPGIMADTQRAQTSSKWGPLDC